MKFTAIFQLNFLKPTSFHFGYDYYASVRMVASQLNHKIILLLKRPLTHNWSSSLIRTQLESEIISDKWTFDNIMQLW